MPSTSEAACGSRPTDSNAPIAPKAMCPRAARGMKPAGAGTTAYPPARASDAIEPPEAIAITRHPRATASRKHAIVSAVLPE